mgnify:CR=1 FL=1
MTDTIIATLNKAGVRNISTDLWGIFYEDISYSGDGGLTPTSYRTAHSNTIAPTPPTGATTASGAKSCPPAPSQPSTCSPTIR